MNEKTIAAALALAFTAGVFAQSTELSALRVTATPIVEDNRIDAFSSLRTVVGEDQVREENAVDLASALRRTPGVQISRFNPVGAFGGSEGGAIFVRGLGAKHSVLNNAA